MEQPFQKSGEREQTSPHAHPFDKLQAVRKLTGEKFPEKQAMAIVETIEDACDGLATQVGMERMELALRSDMERMELALRGDMERMEASLRGDMERVETSLRGDMCNEIEKVELRLRADMGGMRADIQAEFKRFYWYIPVVMGTVVGILKFT